MAADLPGAVWHGRLPVRLPGRRAFRRPRTPGGDPRRGDASAHRAPGGDLALAGASRSRRSPCWASCCSGRWTWRGTQPVRRSRSAGVRFRANVAAHHMLQPLVRFWGRNRQRNGASRDLGAHRRLPEGIRRVRGGIVVVPEDRPRSDLAAALVSALRETRDPSPAIERLGGLRRAAAALGVRLRGATDQQPPGGVRADPDPRAAEAVAVGRGRRGGRGRCPGPAHPWNICDRACPERPARRVQGSPVRPVLLCPPKTS